MSLIYADGQMPHVPEDLTISQFILDGRHPTRPSWVWEHPKAWLIEEATGREIGKEEVQRRVYALANALKMRWNIGEDDVVCIFSHNHVDYIVVVWAVHVLGGTVSTANPTYTAEELSYQLSLTKARLVIADLSTLPVASEGVRASGISPGCLISFDPVSGESYPDVQILIAFGSREAKRYRERRLSEGEGRTKLAFLSFSSGTTGKPKAVMISHYSFIANIVQIAQYLRLNDTQSSSFMKVYDANSVVLGTLPFYHAYGMHMGLLITFFLGASIVVSPKFQFERMLHSIQRYHISHLYVVPPQVVLLCKSPKVKQYDLSSVTYLICGAAPLGAELIEKLARILPNSVIGQGYGMTELATGATSIPLDRRVGEPGSAGVLLPGIVARVVRQDGTVAGFNELGELHLKTPSMSLGYLNDPTATAETFRDGWVHTGDEVIIDERKEVFVVDRIKELIKVRGLQVAPSELESHLLDHPDVADVCVVGIPDDFSGELPFAFIVLNDGARVDIEAHKRNPYAIKEAMVAHVAEHKAKYKRLAGVEFADMIPKNPSGKLLRRVLREKAKEMLSQGKMKLMPKSKL
ncbi:amp dependent CoA ligase [Dichomitus squalens]|uniref:Amp dependent CoA ligase n=1 Tax=Dichomitus squalens TaxID=114155 RepID=A0A4Q9M945_9APHY|nr:amp dependent CoA ligase [Dichomitus squalens]